MTTDQLVAFLGFPTTEPRWAKYIERQTPKWRKALAGLARALEILQEKPDAANKVQMPALRSGDNDCGKRKRRPRARRKAVGGS